jgi:predicted RNA-binding protein with PIN domain
MYRWLIIDGNNLIHASPDFASSASRSFDLARRRLVQQLDELVNVLAVRITVVFDGRGGNPSAGFENAAVEVVFSPAHLTADSVIERLATQSPDRAAATVVSSDLLERHTVEAGGVHTLSCRTFLDELHRARANLHRQLRDTGRPGRKNALGDFFPGG